MINTFELSKETEFNEQSAEYNKVLDLISYHIKKNNLKNVKVIAHPTFILGMARRLFETNIFSEDKRARNIVKEVLGKEIREGESDNLVYIYSLEEMENFKGKLEDDIKKLKNSSFLFIASRNKYSYKLFLGKRKNTLNFNKLKNILIENNFKILNVNSALHPEYIFYLGLSILFDKLGRTELFIRYKDKAQQNYFTNYKKFSYINIIIAKKKLF